MSAQDFGANDWLVDEMYEQFLQDPSSVDPAWVEYFKTNKPGAPATTAAPSKGVPPIPKAQQQAAGMALSAKRGEIKVSTLKGAAKSMYISMTKDELEKYAGTSRKGLPKKVKK